MEEKISTLILKVDLDCNHCYKKIRKTLSKLQEKEAIRSIVYDEKKNTVLVSGPFDPQRMIKKICCKASKVIKDIQIKKCTDKSDDKKNKSEENKDKSDDKKNKSDENKDKSTETADDNKDKSDDKKDKDKSTEKADDKKDKSGFEKGCQPVCLCGPGCYCMPWSEGYYGDYRRCSCGCGGGRRGCNCGYGGGRGPYGWAPERPPIVIYNGPTYGSGGGYEACEFICEDDSQPSCSVM